MKTVLGILVLAGPALVVTAIAWWLGGAGWGIPILLVSLVVVLGFWGLVLTLDAGEQLLALAMVLISPVRKQSAAYTATTCQEMPPAYYGRVYSKGQQTVLQYFLFYALNDWPTHGGSNYHQGDWEAVFVYLKEQDGEPKIRATHLGLSAHHKGHAWEWKHVRTEKSVDENTQEVHEHPVVYVAAGSHANYRVRGDKPLPDIISPKRKGWGYRIARALLWGRQSFHEAGEELADRVEEEYKRRGLDDESLPRDEFVETKEYHKGEGRIIGPTGLQTDEEFTAWPDPVVLKDGDLPGWVAYRGVWGAKTLHRDVSGPPGPRWQRSEDVEQPGKEERAYWRAPFDWRDDPEVLRAPSSEAPQPQARAS